mmetsp:Transcript_10700/g.34171  ORF Transcript_10700/g.34171 Transcript_10700/m.34171 type:complete len:300 (-) Transcript_10700:92-991(-)
MAPTATPAATWRSAPHPTPTWCSPTVATPAACSRACSPAWRSSWSPCSPSSSAQSGPAGGHRQCPPSWITMRCSACRAPRSSARSTVRSAPGPAARTPTTARALAARRTSSGSRRRSQCSEIAGCAAALTMRFRRPGRRSRRSSPPGRVSWQRGSPSAAAASQRRKRPLRRRQRTSPPRSALRGSAPRWRERCSVSIARPYAVALLCVCSGGGCTARQDRATRHGSARRGRSSRHSPRNMPARRSTLWPSSSSASGWARSQCTAPSSWPPTPSPAWRRGFGCKRCHLSNSTKLTDRGKT